MKEVSKVNSYNTRRGYITIPHLHKAALFLPLPPPLPFVPCALSLSLSVAYITCKNTLDLI